MDNQCLLTKLKTTVNNDVVVPLGYVAFDIDSDVSIEGAYFSFHSKEGATFKVIGEGTVNGQKEGTFISNPSFYNSINLALSAGKYRVLISSYNSLCFTINNPGITGDISGYVQYFSDKTGLKQNSFYINSPVTCDIKHFGGYINHVLFNFSNSKIFGSIESLAEAQVANGRTNGTLNINCNGIISYNGSPVSNGVIASITFSSSGYEVSV